MNSGQNPAGKWEDPPVNVKVKLSALWAVLMFIYIYVDIFALYEPGTIANILQGKVAGMDITPTWAFGALVLMAIPSSMIFLSLALAARVNRWVNIGVAAVYILIAVVNPLGETWGYFWLGSGIEIVLLLAVVWYSWKWPKAG